MVADEDDLYVVVFCAQETYHPEVEAAGDILLEFAHTTTYIHHGYHHGIGLVTNRWLPYLEAEVFRLDILEFGVALGSVALHVLQDGALLVQVGHGAFFADISKAHGLGLEFLLTFLFKIRQAKVFKDHGSQFFHGDFGFIVVLPCLFARIPLLAFAGSRFLGYDIANFTLAVALACMLLSTGIIAETVLLEGANRHPHHLLTI